MMARARPAIRTGRHILWEETTMHIREEGVGTSRPDDPATLDAAYGKITLRLIPYIFVC
jgi:hypothetical protein